MQQPPRVLILGAGFGGTYAARGLRAAANRGEISVTIVDRANHFLFTPLLHEVATGSLTPSSVTEPLREIFAGDAVTVLRGEVERVDLDRRVATVSGVELAYDHVVLASGARSQDYGTPGVAEHALALKSLSDALLVRRAVVGAFERFAAPLASPRRQPRFVVVGGGATGVEIASELAEYAGSLARRYFPGAPAAGPLVTLLDAGAALVSMFPASVQAAAERALAAERVAVCHGCKITAITPAGVERAGEPLLEADVVVWAAGVAAQLPPLSGDVEVVGGRLAVESSLQVKGRPEAFALGDCAAALGENGKPLPMLAQVAIQQAATVAANVLAAARGRATRAFRYRSKGSLVSLGRGKAAGVIFGVPISGFVAWFIWRTTYLSKFASWKKRLRIAFEWAVGLFFARETTEA